MDPFTGGTALHQPTPPSHIPAYSEQGNTGPGLVLMLPLISHQKETNKNMDKKEAGG